MSIGNGPICIDGVQRLPDDIREYSGLDRIDHADQAVLRTDLRRSAEDWARAMFGDEPNVSERLIWQVALRNRLEPGRSPDTIAGWRIGHREHDRIRLESPSPILTGRLIVTTDDDLVTLTTCIRWDTRRGTAVLRALLPLHRMIVPRIVLTAVKRLMADGSASESNSRDSIA